MLASIRPQEDHVLDGEEQWTVDAAGAMSLFHVCENQPETAYAGATNLFEVHIFSPEGKPWPTIFYVMKWIEGPL